MPSSLAPMPSSQVTLPLPKSSFPHTSLITPPATNTSESRMPKKIDNSSEEPKKVLDLLDDSKKQSRRQRQKSVAEVLIAPSKLDKAKANALDIFSEEGKPKARKQVTDAKKGIGGISKILDHAGKDPTLHMWRHPHPLMLPPPAMKTNPTIRS